MWCVFLYHSCRIDRKVKGIPAKTMPDARIVTVYHETGGGLEKESEEGTKYLIGDMNKLISHSLGKILNPKSYVGSNTSLEKTRQLTYVSKDKYISAMVKCLYFEGS